MKRILLLALFVVVLAAPAALAQSSDRDVREYTAFVFVGRSATGALPATEFTWERPHDWNATAHQTLLHIHVSYVTQSGVTNPTADFRVVFNGAPHDACSWRVEGGTVTGAARTANVGLWCNVGPTEPGTHTFQIERTSVSGTPITTSTTSLTLTQTETVNMDLNVNLATAADLYLVALFWGGLVLFFLWTRAAAPAYTALIILGTQLFDPPLLPFVGGIILLSIVTFIHVIVRHGPFLLPKKDGDAQ